MGKNEAIEIAKKFSNAVVSLLPVEKIFLFGSYSRNQQNENSDIDIAVIVEELENDFLETHAKLFALRNKIDLRIEPHLLEEGYDPSGFLEEIYKTGIIIYQNN